MLKLVHRSSLTHGPPTGSDRDVRHLALDPAARAGLDEQRRAEDHQPAAQRTVVTDRRRGRPRRARRSTSSVVITIAVRVAGGGPSPRLAERREPGGKIARQTTVVQSAVLRQ